MIFFMIEAKPDVFFGDRTYDNDYFCGKEIKMASTHTKIERHKNARWKRACGYKRPRVVRWFFPLDDIKRQLCICWGKYRENVVGFCIFLSLFSCQNDFEIASNQDWAKRALYDPVS